jgi:hypothetical protein
MTYLWKGLMIAVIPVVMLLWWIGWISRDLMVVVSLTVAFASVVISRWEQRRLRPRGDQQ